MKGFSEHIVAVEGILKNLEIYGYSNIKFIRRLVLFALLTPVLNLKAALTFFLEEKTEKYVADMVASIIEITSIIEKVNSLIKTIKEEEGIRITSPMLFTMLKISVCTEEISVITKTLESTFKNHESLTSESNNKNDHPADLLDWVNNLNIEKKQYMAKPLDNYGRKICMQHLVNLLNEYDLKEGVKVLVELQKHVRESKKKHPQTLDKNLDFVRELLAKTESILVLKLAKEKGQDIDMNDFKIREVLVSELLDKVGKSLKPGM